MIPLKFRSVCDHFTFLSLSPKDYDFLKKEIFFHENRKCIDHIVN